MRFIKVVNGPSCFLRSLLVLLVQFLSAQGLAQGHLEGTEAQSYILRKWALQTSNLTQRAAQGPESVVTLCRLLNEAGVLTPESATAAKDLILRDDIPLLSPSGKVLQGDSRKKALHLLSSYLGVNGQKPKFDPVSCFLFDWEKGLAKGKSVPGKLWGKQADPSQPADDPQDAHHPEQITIKSEKALAIRAIVHIRDYDNPETKDFVGYQLDEGKFYFDKGHNATDTMHVYGVTASALRQAQFHSKTKQKVSTELKSDPKETVDALLKSMDGGHHGWYQSSDETHALRQGLHHVFFNASTKAKNHKMPKGPVEGEEWDSFANSGVQALCYKNGQPCSFFDLKKSYEPTRDTEGIYVLFEAGDGSDEKGGKNPDDSREDLMALFRVPSELLMSNVGTKFWYVQRDPTAHDRADLIVLMEIVDSSQRKP